MTIDPDQTLTLKAGGLLFTGAHDYNITGGTLTGSGGTQKNLVVHQFGGGNLIIDSVIANNLAASGLVKTGTGTLTLGSANTQTGTSFATWNASAATQGLTTVTIAPSPNNPTPGTTTVTATISGPEPAKIFVRAVATQP